MTTYRIALSSAYHNACTDSVGPRFAWTPAVEAVCTERTFTTYNAAFRTMLKVQGIAGGVWCVLECLGETGLTTW